MEKFIISGIVVIIVVSLKYLTRGFLNLIYPVVLKRIDKISNSLKDNEDNISWVMRQFCSVFGPTWVNGIGGIEVIDEKGGSFYDPNSNTLFLEKFNCNSLLYKAIYGHEIGHMANHFRYTYMLYLIETIGVKIIYEDFYIGLIGLTALGVVMNSIYLWIVISIIYGFILVCRLIQLFDELTADNNSLWFLTNSTSEMTDELGNKYDSIEGLDPNSKELGIIRKSLLLFKTSYIMLTTCSILQLSLIMWLILYIR